MRLRTWPPPRFPLIRDTTLKIVDALLLDEFRSTRVYVCGWMEISIRV